LQSHQAFPFMIFGPGKNSSHAIIYRFISDFNN